MPAGLQVETVVPDGAMPKDAKGEGALWIVSATKLLRLTLKADEHGKLRGTKLAPVAEVGSPSGAVARAADGELLLANGATVKRVTKEGRVTDVIDSGAAAAGAGIGEIFGLALAADGSLRLSDWEKGRVLLFKDGTLSELATGLEHPSGVVLAKDGSLLFKESGRQDNTTGRVRRVAAGGTVTLVAKLERAPAR